MGYRLAKCAVCSRTFAAIADDELYCHGVCARSARKSLEKAHEARFQKKTKDRSANARVRTLADLLRKDPLLENWQLHERGWGHEEIVKARKLATS